MEPGFANERLLTKMSPLLLRLVAPVCKVLPVPKNVLLYILTLATLDDGKYCPKVIRPAQPERMLLATNMSSVCDPSSLLIVKQALHPGLLR